MATYTYTGRLTDFGEAPFPNAVPELWVEPRRAAFGPQGPLATRRIRITVSSNGSFSVILVPSVDTTPETTYHLFVRWLHADGNVAGQSEWKFTAAIGGGQIKDMALIPVTRFWSGPTPPPRVGPGLWWLDTSQYPYLLKEWI